MTQHLGKSGEDDVMFAESHEHATQHSLVSREGDGGSCLVQHWPINV